MRRSYDGPPKCRLRPGKGASKLLANERFCGGTAAQLSVGGAPAQGNDARGGSIFTRPASTPQTVDVAPDPPVEDPTTRDRGRTRHNACCARARAALPSRRGSCPLHADSGGSAAPPRSGRVALPRGRQCRPALRRPVGTPADRGDARGRSQHSQGARAGAALGELALLTGSVRSAGAQAVRDSQLLEIARPSFDRLLESDPRFGHAIAVQFSHGSYKHPAASKNPEGGRASSPFSEHPVWLAARSCPARAAAAQNASTGAANLSDFMRYVNPRARRQFAEIVTAADTVRLEPQRTCE